MENSSVQMKDSSVRMKNSSVRMKDSSARMDLTFARMEAFSERFFRVSFDEVLPLHYIYNNTAGLLHFVRKDGARQSVQNSCCRMAKLACIPCVFRVPP
jgi:hypothetical protein